MEPKADYLPTLRELRYLRKYPVDERALLHLIFTKRYGTPDRCPRCGQAGRVYQGNTRPRMFIGAYCGHHTAATAGTIFHKSRIPLHTWFDIIYDIYLSEGKIPVAELYRRYPCASYRIMWAIKKKITNYLAIDLPSHAGYSYQYSSKQNGRYYQTDYRKKHNLI